MDNNIQHISIPEGEFEEKVNKIWEELDHEKYFSDVTLVCDGKQVRAHKAVISTCSPVLRNILKQNVEMDPLIYLGGVTKTNLDNLLNFMYHGEANVLERELGSFCKIAEDIKIEGFSKKNNSEVERSYFKCIDIDNLSKRNRTIGKNKEHMNSEQSYKEMKMEKVVSEQNYKVKIKKEEGKSDEVILPKLFETFAKNAETFVRSSDHDGLVVSDHNKDDTFVTSNPTGIFCPYCGKSFTQKGSRGVHIRTIHEGIRHPCSFCDHFASTKSNLKQHIEAKHKVLDPSVTDVAALSDVMGISHTTTVDAVENHNEQSLEGSDTGLVNYSSSENNDSKHTLDVSDIIYPIVEHETTNLQEDTVLHNNVSEMIKIKEEKQKEQEISQTREYSCGQCDKSFQRRDHLDVHTKASHLGVRFACLKCDYQSTTAGNLKRHIGKRHSNPNKDSNNTLENGEIIFPVVQNENLNLFEANIKEEIDHLNCAQANSDSTVDEDIKEDVLHSEKAETKQKEQKIYKKYSCDQCDKSFRQSGHLSIHIKASHLGVRFPCLSCDYQSTTTGNLKRHIENRHSDPVSF